MLEKLYPYKEAADLLLIEPPSLRKYVSKGIIKAKKIGKRVYVPLCSLLILFERRFNGFESRKTLNSEEEIVLGYLKENYDSLVEDINTKGLEDKLGEILEVSQIAKILNEKVQAVRNRLLPNNLGKYSVFEKNIYREIRNNGKSRGKGNMYAKVNKFFIRYWNFRVVLRKSSPKWGRTPIEIFSIEDRIPYSKIKKELIREKPELYEYLRSMSILPLAEKHKIPHKFNLNSNDVYFLPEDAITLKDVVKSSYESELQRVNNIEANARDNNFSRQHIEIFDEGGPSDEDLEKMKKERRKERLEKIMNMKNNG